MGNKKRRLQPQEVQTYKRILEDEGKTFKPNKENRYRMSNEMYNKVQNGGYEVLDHLFIKGRSSYIKYDKEGNATKTAEWVKEGLDQEKRKAVFEATIEALKSDIIPLEPIQLEGKNLEDRLLNQYTITDFHLGMLASFAETGTEWNLKKAETMFKNWVDVAIHNSPNSENAVFANIGDFLHFDSLLPVTPQSKHVLDASARYVDVVRSALRLIRYAIMRMLTKHEKVSVFMCEGNHDMASSVWLREVFSMYFENEDRVEVNTHADPFYAHEFGDVALFYHHQHKRRGLDTIPVFVNKFREMYGRTKYHYAHTGDLHHDKVLEHTLMKVEQHRTLSPQDAYSNNAGFGSGRDAKVITYHADFGEVGRNVISPNFVNYLTT